MLFFKFSNEREGVGKKMLEERTLCEHTHMINVNENDTRKMVSEKTGKERFKFYTFFFCCYGMN